MKLAVVLFNLGGPDSPDAVEAFLRNLFSDPAIIALPAPLRLPLAWFIARRRTPIARAIYAHIGGRSPILEETRAQADALEAALAGDGLEVKAFIAMRYWHPFADEAARAVKAFAPDQIVLLPLYPQFSTTTTASSFDDWSRAAKATGLAAPAVRICCYPRQPGFAAAVAEHIRAAMAGARPDISYRLLLSAHGLPKRIVQKGDPYPWQVEQSAAAIVRELAMPGLEPVVCYQSRVGPLEWIGPATDAEIRRAGADGKGVIVAPVAFVSEHSETLVELDIEYGRLAREAGVKDYRRARTAGIEPAFIGGLANLVRQAISAGAPREEKARPDIADSSGNSADGRACPEDYCRCDRRGREGRQ
ncbi:MAG TPA: ferrochelatase [Rhizomicrobium sp.]|nr:ferrochelatase [Rhizomicrobium sp.]